MTTKLCSGSTILQCPSGQANFPASSSAARVVTYRSKRNREPSTSNFFCNTKSSVVSTAGQALVTEWSLTHSFFFETNLYTATREAVSKMLVAKGSWFLSALRLICRSWLERTLAADAAGVSVTAGDLLLVLAAIVVAVFVLALLLVKLVLRLRIFIVLRLLKTI